MKESDWKNGILNSEMAKQEGKTNHNCQDQVLNLMDLLEEGESEVEDPSDEEK
jgi:hypothetical protein